MYKKLIALKHISIWEAMLKSKEGRIKNFLEIEI
jgi:hypothetical protein